MFGAESCPSLAGKPKIFFIQACRGSQQDKGVLVEPVPEVETDGCGSQQNFFFQYLAIPEDTVVHFSSCPDYSSFLRPTGSTFLQTLYKVLSGEQRHWELLRIMTRVNCLVALTFESRGQHGGKKQMPCFVTKLRQEVYLSVESKASSL
ncbi:caspase-7-like isoform X2 [Narcine bancroftii]